jgi:ABC-type sulfate transport system permease component
MNYPSESYLRVLQSKLNKNIREVLKSYILIEHFQLYVLFLLLLLLLLLLSSLFKKNYLYVVSYRLYVSSYSHTLIISLYCKPIDTRM